MAHQEESAHEPSVSAAAEHAGEAVSAPGSKLGQRRWRGLLDQRRVPLVQPGPHVVRGVGPALPLVAREHRTGRGDTGEAGQSEELPEAHGP